MKIPKKSRRQKLFFALGATGLLILLALVSRIGPRQFSSELLFKTEMIETIKNEVAEVRSARAEYFAEIGYGNSGAYDQYQIDSNCIADLDRRLLSLKNLRNDFKKMIAVADFHFFEQQIQSRERAVESMMARILDDETDVTLEKSVAEIGLDEKTKAKLDALELEIKKIMNEVLSDEELTELKKNESAKRTKFQQATKEFENCAQIYQKVESCAGELSKWFVARDEYQALVLELQNLAVEKEREATERMAPIQAEIDELLNSNI
jgi:hypothetical protein